MKIDLTQDERKDTIQILRNEVETFLKNSEFCGENFNTLMALIFFLEAVNNGSNFFEITFKISGHYIHRPVISNNKIDLLRFKDELLKD